ncbi:MAG TPA: hypothetical protein VM364_04205 [Vicinamibacterales bacterium]|nr:hypothetical protein [Vicinamibacterales bacterium]
MNMTYTEILSALVDGESVDPAAVAAALEDAGARAALVDFVRLRNAARADAAPLPASLDRLRAAGPPRRVLRWAAAAAALVLTFMAGLLTAVSWRPDARDPAAPPQPARVERFEPGVDWHPSN